MAGTGPAMTRQGLGINRRRQGQARGVAEGVPADPRDGDTLGTGFFKIGL